VVIAMQEELHEVESEARKSKETVAHFVGELMAMLHTGIGNSSDPSIEVCTLT
jgi:hypothetical protein